MMQGNRRRDCCGSLSVRSGESSVEGSFLISMTSRLEHEPVGEWEVEDRGELRGGACDDHVDVDDEEEEGEN